MAGLNQWTHTGRRHTAESRAELLLVVSTCVVRRRVAHPLAYNVLKLQAPKSRDWSSII